MRIRRVTILTAFTAAVASASCGGGGFNPESSASYRLAVHLDTLAAQAARAREFDRYRLLSYPIAALMENVSPSTVSLTIDGTATQYQGVVLELVGTYPGSPPLPSESIYVVVAWSDSDAHEVVYAEVGLPDTLEDWADLSNASANFALDSANSVSVGLSGATGHCHTFSLPLANAAVADFLQGTTCSKGAASAAYTMYFTPDTTNPHGVFSLASQPVNAVRLVLPTANGGVERIRHDLGLERFNRRR